MRYIEHIYIDGQFVTPHGTARADLFNPATEDKIGEVRLGDEVDAQAATCRRPSRLHGDVADHACRTRRDAAAIA